jgi:hypothetical protein
VYARWPWLGDPRQLAIDALLALVHDLRAEQERQVKATVTTDPKAWFAAVTAGAIGIDLEEVAKAKAEFQQQQGKAGVAT